MKNAAILFTLSTCAFAFLSDVRAARVHKQYVGHDCRVYGYQGNDTSLNPVGNKATGLKNSGSSTINVVCDLHGAYFPYDVTGRLTFKKPSSGSANMNCELYARNLNGSSWETASTTVTAGNGTNTVQVSAYFGDGVIAQLVSTSLYCELPANYEILQYVVDSHGAFP